MEAAANLLLLAVGVASIVVWIVNLVRWDGTKPCNPEDCESCPFPPCEEHDAEQNQKGNDQP